MIIRAPLHKNDFKRCVHKDFGDYMIKFVADLSQEILAYDAEWHADLETTLLEAGSAQDDLWGFNYYPDTDTLEYNSLINVRPKVNKSTDILIPEICEHIERVFQKWVRDE